MMILRHNHKDSVVDIAKEFDLSKPGEYLVNVSRQVRLTTLNGNETKHYGPSEYLSGNLLINIIPGVPGAPDEPTKNAAPNASAATSSAKGNGKPNQTAIPEASSVGSPPITATSGASGTAPMENPAAVASGAKNSVESTASGTPSGRTGTGVARNTGMALLFGLLGLGVLWWLFRGK